MISQYFTRSEFECKCGCGFAAVDVELLKVLERVRVHFGLPVIITSACRCERHNIAVGGTVNSKHKLGIAADIQVKGVDPTEVFDFLHNNPPSHGLSLGKYETFTHVDVREGNARWRG
mgnify:CR=1 FL=1